MDISVSDFEKMSKDKIIAFALVENLIDSIEEATKLSKEQLVQLLVNKSVQESLNPPKDVYEKYPKFKKGKPSKKAYKKILQKALVSGKTCRPIEDNCGEGFACEVSNIKNPEVKSSEDFGVCVPNTDKTIDYIGSKPTFFKDNIRIFGNKSNVMKFKKYVDKISSVGAEETKVSSSPSVEIPVSTDGINLDALKVRFNDMTVSQLKKYLKKNFSSAPGSLPKGKDNLVAYAIYATLDKKCGKDNLSCSVDEACEISNGPDDGICVPKNTKEAQYCKVFKGKKFYGSKRALKNLSKSLGMEGADCEDMISISIPSPPPSPVAPKNPFDVSLPTAQPIVGRNPFDVSLPTAQSIVGRNPFDLSLSAPSPPQIGVNPFDEVVTSTEEVVLRDGVNPFDNSSIIQPVLDPNVLDLDYSKIENICKYPLVAYMESKDSDLKRILALKGIDRSNIPKKKSAKITLICSLEKGKTCSPIENKLCNDNEACAIIKDDKGICVPKLETWRRQKGYRAVKKDGKLYFGKKEKISKLRKYFKNLGSGINIDVSGLGVPEITAPAIAPGIVATGLLATGLVAPEITAPAPAIAIAPEITAAPVALEISPEALVPVASSDKWGDVMVAPEISPDADLSPSPPVVVKNYEDIRKLLSNINAEGTELDKRTKEKISKCLGLIS